MAKVIEINDINQLGQHRMAWNALFAETPGATFFQTFDWFSIFWQHFGHEMKLRVLVVRAARQVIGIVPLCVREQRHRLGTLRTLCYPLDGWAPSYGPLGANPTATLALAMKHIASTSRDWDRIELEGVTHETIDRGRTYRAMQLAGLRPTLTAAEENSLIELPSDWEEYLAGMGKKARHEMRRHLRRIAEAEDACYTRHRPRPMREGAGDPRWDLYDQCEQVAAASWQSGVKDGNTLCHPRYREFYRDTHAAAARLGMLDLNLLTIGDRPVAFNYNYLTDGRVTGLRMGFDPTFQEIKGIGLGLLAMMLRDSCRRGDRLLDMGPGGQAYKLRLRTGASRTHHLEHSPRNAWRAQVLRLGHWFRGDAAAG